MDSLRHIRIYRWVLIACIAYFAVTLLVAFVLFEEWQSPLFSTADPLIALLGVLNNLLVGVFASSLLAFFLTRSSYAVRQTTNIIAFSNELQDVAKRCSQIHDINFSLGGITIAILSNPEYPEACLCFKGRKKGSYDMLDAYHHASQLLSDLDEKLSSAGSSKMTYMRSMTTVHGIYESVCKSVAEEKAFDYSHARQVLQEAERRVIEARSAQTAYNESINEVHEVAELVLQLSDEIRSHVEYSANFMLVSKRRCWQRRERLDAEKF